MRAVRFALVTATQPFLNMVDNAACTAELRSMLDGLVVSPAVLSVKLESSYDWFMVQVPKDSDLEQVEGAANYFGQLGVVVVDEARAVWVVTPDKARGKLGVWNRVFEPEAPAYFFRIGNEAFCISEEVT